LILTLTVNPAIDRNVSADRLVFEDRAYILSTDLSAGGRGINASRVIHSFGGQTLAILTSGGKSGARLEELVRAHGFPVEVARIRNEIRTNLTITDKQGLTVKLNEAGPMLDKRELDGLEKITVRQLEHAGWLMLCGSVPPGVPADFYARLIETARKKKERPVKEFALCVQDPKANGAQLGEALDDRVQDQAGGHRLAGPHTARGDPAGLDEFHERHHDRLSPHRLAEAHFGSRLIPQGLEHLANIAARGKNRLLGERREVRGRLPLDTSLGQFFCEPG